LTSCNVGGFGIDGPVSTLIGASLASPEKIHFGIIGDLAFFYDLNSIGNRHLGKNLRILLINNGVGTEFRNYDHPAAQWGHEANRFIAAGGHFGQKSKVLVKHYVEDLGFDYLSANTKEEFQKNTNRFLSLEKSDKPIVFEVFTTPEDESVAIHLIRTIVKDDRTLTDKVFGKLHKVANRIMKK
jgi:2-succinyl-5-enolpyruvyl-6-hydroxy-3-cyclohexene-1-carboxylate synthase